MINETTSLIPDFIECALEAVDGDFGQRGPKCTNDRREFDSKCGNPTPVPVERKERCFVDAESDPEPEVVENREDRSKEEKTDKLIHSLQETQPTAVGLCSCCQEKPKGTSSFHTRRPSPIRLPTPTAISTVTLRRKRGIDTSSLTLGFRHRVNALQRQENLSLSLR
ncbi:hypothetical protein K435DRAFT_870610 [Dendrothele bispora CBS 962.96]|uniref:Uncharacterized protein n=1 Tax=Dendrothele bispora (strain CBS 962.96) TaxID=1314807 RepID=A0A4S8L6L1_DENBC|nr:hypothetical protein K435DRAFT_870610 [Dendrothele bispora CBS 962.96]